MWFKNLFGFEEISPENVRDNIEVSNRQLTSKVNGKTYQFGNFELLSLNSLRSKTNLSKYSDAIQISEIVANIRDIHNDIENKDAVFQVASQFNMLEMISPEIIPERGVDIYENDHTQGPSCAIACGAGTVYRNYFVPLNGKIGQSRNNQIDGLEDIGNFFDNEKLNLWQMRNGYCFLTDEGLNFINKKIKNLSADQYEELKGLLKTGIQWISEVTTSKSRHAVTQIYCSALPVGYSSYIPAENFEIFARLILEATYEATLLTALINYENTGCRKLFLTLVGGGVFGNNVGWILDSIGKCVQKFKNTPLDVKIVSYGKSNIFVQKFLENYL